MQPKLILIIILAVLASVILFQYYQGEKEEPLPMYRGEITLEPNEIKGVCVYRPPGEDGSPMNYIAAGENRFSLISLPYDDSVSPGSEVAGNRRERDNWSWTLREGSGGQEPGRSCLLIDNRKQSKKGRVKLLAIPGGLSMRESAEMARNFPPEEIPPEERLPPVAGVIPVANETIELKPGEKHSTCFNSSISGRDYLQISLKTLVGKYPYVVDGEEFKKIYGGNFEALRKDVIEMGKIGKTDEWNEAALYVIIVLLSGQAWEHKKVLNEENYVLAENFKNPVLLIPEAMEGTEHCFTFESHSNRTAVYQLSVEKHVREERKSTED